VNLPFVTIVMPIRNEEAFIERSLGAVLAQDYLSTHIEVLIADGMSDDRTLEIIRAMPGAERVRVVPNPRRIQSAGLNLVIPQARGEYIIRVDGHTILAPDYVSTCVRLLQETGADNVGGAMNPVGITPMGKAIAAAGKSAFAVPTAFHVSDRAQYTDTVYLGAWPRGVFERVGLYNERVGVNEDYELNYRIRQSGGKIYFSPIIRSDYYGRQTLRALWRQYYRYGKSRVKTLAQHPGSLKPRHLVAPLFVAGLAGGLLLGLLLPPLLLLWAFGVALYAGVNLAFSARVASRAGWELFPRLSVVFLVIHVAWGAGFWAGLFQVNRGL
jgi:glycosyltransferase involved in cell wall biosynthesis